MQLLIGCDPEGFLEHKGELVSAHGLFPGDKANPFKVEKGAVQVDGMAFEFNIEPAASADEFVVNIAEVMAQLQGMIPEYELILQPVAEFGQEYIDSQPDAAKEMGCDPDYNAWSGEANVKPDANLPFHTASGHVHIGWTEGQHVGDPEHAHACRSIVKQLDFFLGLPSLMFDGDVKRRSMYGAAGAYRPKPYGVEYRVLSNAWVKDEGLTRWVYEAVHEGLERLQAGDALFTRYDIQEIINNSDVEAAKAIIAKENLSVPVLK